MKSNNKVNHNEEFDEPDNPDDEEYNDDGKEINQKEMIDKLLEEAEKANFTEFDGKLLKKSIVNLETLISKNQELRQKYSKQPELFMDSEVELDEEIKKIQQITAYPELLKTLIDLQGVPILLSILGHENTDIIADIIEVSILFLHVHHSY